MSPLAIALGSLALVFAAAAVLLGRNLTRSIMAGYACVGILCLVLTLSGFGFAAIAMCLMAAIGLASIQVFGWMLVDIDRDHLTPTDVPTWIARVLAFILLGGGLAILTWFLMISLGQSQGLSSPSVAAIGRVFFGQLGGVAILLGVAMAAVLLAAMLLLRGSGEGG